MSRSPVLAVFLALVVVASGAVAMPRSTDVGSVPDLSGRALSEALRLLQDRGWPVVFSSRLVRDSMRVASQPQGASRAALLEDLLRPHGLAVRPGARDRMVVVAAEVRRAAVETGRGHAPTPASGRLEPATRATVPSAPTTLPPGSDASVEEEILVTPARDLRRGSAVVTFDRDSGDFVTPPQVGEDALGAVAVLPGAGGADGSGQLNVRGGDGDDVLVRLDGLELVRPYHLGDFDNAMSFVTPSAVGRAELFTGGYPAQYGDRMGGVVDLTTRSPTPRRHYSLGLSTADAEGAISGPVSDQASWLLTARRGSYQWPLEFKGLDEHPRYWDAFGKVALDLGTSQTLIADVLVARDQFELSSEHRGPDETYASAWDSGYAWIRHTFVLDRDLYAESVAGAGDVNHERSGRSTVLDDQVAARDHRAFGSFSARQDWHWEATPLGAVEWGFDYERSRTRLDFQSERPADALGSTGTDSAWIAALTDEDFEGTNLAAYASTQLHPWRRLSLDLGLRHDTLTVSDENQWSPRVSAAWEISPKSSVQASWGWFYQSQRPYELQLEERDADGIAGIGSERSEHQDLRFERHFARGLAVELSAYRRRIDSPRVRFENLFDPVLVFPELGPDRVRIAPERASSEGVELTVRQPRLGRFGWWATFVESSAVDQIDGRPVPRSTDQPESFRAGLSMRAGRGFDLDLVWQYHTGWPTTAIEARSVVRDDGSIEWLPALGPRNGERLPDYHRLDLRVARSWSVGPGRLEAHLDLLDLYDRDNLRGFEDIRLTPDGNGGVVVNREPVTWTGFVPSVGLRWSF